MKPPVVPPSAATKRRARWAAFAAFILVCFSVAVVAHATSSGWIFLGGPIADQGVGTPPGGEVDLTIGNADHVATSAEFYGQSVQVLSSVSLTAPRAVTVPTESGAFKIVTNSTTGGFSITWGGATGAVVTVANGQTLALNCPDGANWVIAGGSGSGFDAASGIPASDITGLVGVTQGGTGLDAACPSGTFLSGDGSVDYCRAIASSDITFLVGVTQGGTGLDASCPSGTFLSGDGSVDYCKTIASGELTTALASPPAIGGTTPAAGTFSTITGRSGTRYADSGGSTVEIPSACSGFATSGNGPVDSCSFTATFTDATTWVNLFPTGFLVANRTSGVLDIEYNITDQTDAADAGPVDQQLGQFRFSFTSSNGGGITLFDAIGSASSSSALSLTASPTSKSLIAGVAGSVVPTCQVLVTGAYLQPQCKGRSSKTDVGQFTMQNGRSLQ